MRERVLVSGSASAIGVEGSDRVAVPRAGEIMKLIDAS